MVALMTLSELPIIQAPMAGGPSTPALAAAVGCAGGFGFLAAGYLAPAQLVDDIAATRALSAAPFGINIFCPSNPSDLEPVRAFAQAIQPESARFGVALGEPHWDDDAYDDKLDIVESAHVSLVSFTFGCPTPGTVSRLHNADCRVAVTVTSRQEAEVAEGAGADLLVVQGTEAGGHQGSFLDSDPNHTPLLHLLEEMHAGTRIPMVGSGGIMTGSSAAAVLDRGAVAVQLGTAFLCSQEAGTSATHRKALLSRTYPDTVITRAFSGRFARGLANEFAVRYGDLAPEAYPEIHHLTRPLRVAAARAGDPSTPNLWAGRGWRSVTSESARAITRRVADELTSTP
jgi:nitronate monooxygenase